MKIRIIISERARNIGNFEVGRLLPVREKRQVGPFTFIDRMGPAQLGAGNFMDVDQHPHIGLATLTYLFQGEIEHRDSLGTIQRIAPGDAGFMTAGQAITHTERTPKDLRSGKPFRVHGYQIWIALPTQLEEMEPHFEFLAKSEMPEKSEDGCTIRLVAGHGFDMISPLKVWSPLFMADVYAETDTRLNLSEKLSGELAVIVVTGSANTDNEGLVPGKMLISHTDIEHWLHLGKGARVLLIGGEPFPEPRYMLWNFVSSKKEKLEAAKKQWQKKLFPKVPGDETYVPLP